MGLIVLFGLGLFFSWVRKNFGYNAFKYVLNPFLSHFSFWDPYNVNIIVHDVVPGISLTIFIPFHYFIFLFCSATMIFTILSSRLRIYSSVSFSLLLIPSSVFFITVIIFFIFSCLYFLTIC